MVQVDCDMRNGPGVGEAQAFFVLWADQKTGQYNTYYFNRLETESMTPC